MQSAGGSRPPRGRSQALTLASPSPSLHARHRRQWAPRAASASAAADRRSRHLLHEARPADDGARRRACSANDLDLLGGTTAILTADPTHGTVNLRSDGGFTYTPDAGYLGTDVFRYRPTGLLGPRDDRDDHDHERGADRRQ